MKFTVENKITINNKEYTYVVTYKSIKNLYFRVKSDLKIYVTCNRHVSKKYIEDLLINNEKAIIKMMNKIVEQNNLDDKIMYLGNELILIISSDDAHIENDYIYAKDKESAKEFIYQNAYPIFARRVDELKQNYHNLPNFTLRVRKMTSKWGVCNKRSMTVTLNTYLIEKDIHLIDYVIIHELCHFKYMDHSANFWHYVEKFYPYYKEARRELNGK